MVLESGEVEAMEIDLTRIPPKLKVTAGRSGARVIINGRPMGLVPLELNQLKPGKVTVKVELDKCDPFIQRVKLEPATTKTVQAMMQCEGGGASDVKNGVGHLNGSKNSSLCLRHAPRLSILIKMFRMPLGIAAGFVLCGLGSSCKVDAKQLPHRQNDRYQMVAEQIESRGIKNVSVLRAMREVPRHLFVPQAYRRSAYEDRPLPIGHQQTISQPFIVAAMTELLNPQRTDKVLEIGTGSGYQAAVLSRLVKHVYSIEIVKPLADRARKDLKSIGFENITVIFGDGYKGLPKHAPFDGIIVTAAPPEIPKPLLDQLKVGGKMVIPVGETRQELKLLTKTKDGIKTERIFGVRFVPMTGEAQK